MFPEHTLGCSIVATVFFVAWIFMYSDILWESLTFRNHNGIKGHCLSLATVLFLLGFVNFVVFILNKLIG